MSRGAAVGSLPVSVVLLIGPIDLPMPEKTHCRCGTIRLRTGISLELFRRTIAQRRMQSAAIVVLFDELLDVLTQMLQVPVIVGVNLFLLHALHEPFSTCLVIRVPRTTHARDHLVPLQN